MATFRVYVHVALALTVLAVCVSAVVVVPHLQHGSAGRSDFDVEVAALDAEIASMRAAAGASNPEASVRLAYRMYSHAALTGRADAFAALEAFVNALHERLGPRRDVVLLRSTLDVRVHRLPAARALLEESPALADDPDAQLIAADVDLQQGHYDRARRTYQRVVDRNPTWPAVARLAAAAALTGNSELADRLYAEAGDQLTAKEMRTYAWLAVQRGQLAFARGHYEQADAQYRLADRGYSGYWLVDESLGELRAAQRRFDESIAHYRRAIERAPRPDLLQQLGDAYAFMGRTEEAGRWHQRALDGYLASTRRGEVQFFHHLAGYYADVARNGAEAVAWARRDAQLRPGAVTDDTLAWALYADGSIDEAQRAVDRALAGGIVDGHLYYHAMTIKAAAGDAAAAARLAERLHDLNPRYRDFHAHR
jgi:tetratricopeptide (TPR) repeat protein